MTVSKEYNKHIYEGNGLTRDWPYDFDLPITAAGAPDTSLIHVFRTNLRGEVTEVTAFSVDAETGTLTYPTSGDPLETGEKLTILRLLDVRQQFFDPSNQANLYPETLEDSTDRLVMMVQQLQEETDRAVKVSVSTDLETEDITAEGIFEARDIALSAATASEGWANTFPAIADELDVNIVLDEADLRAKLAAIGASNASLVIATTIPIAADLTIPSNVALSFKRAGQLQPAVGTTLTINGAIDAGLWQIFSGAGTISGNPKINCVYPEWFGAVGDGVTDDTAAIQDAIDAVSASGGGTVFIPPGTFMVNMLMGGIFLKDNVQIVGTGTGSILKGIPIAGTSNFVYVVSIANCSNAGISNCLIDASRPVGESDQKQWHGIRLDGNTSNILIENNVIKECKGDGIWIVMNPGFTIPPAKALIRGNRISNVNRQDIALVQGTDITLTDNFGTGSLDIESDSSDYINTGHIISNNRFNTILISPLSGLNGVRNNIVVTGNKCNGMFLWGANFVQVTGNVVNGLITVAQSGDVAIVGNFCQGIGQRVANGTFVEHLVVRDNTIISSTETKGIWLYNVVNAEISDNLIHMSAENAVGIYQSNNNVTAAGEVRIYNNKINTTKNCIHIISTSLNNTTHSIFGNYLKSSSARSIFKDGSLVAGNIRVIDNDIHSNVLVATSTSVEFHKNRYYSITSLKINFNREASSIVLDGERFYGSLPTIEMSYNNVSGSVVVRDCAGEDITIGASAINFWNTTATDVLFDNVVSSSATPYQALAAPVRTGSLIRITGSATRYGVWYNGTSWVDLA